MLELVFGCLLGITPLVAVLASCVYSRAVTYAQEIEDQSKYY